MEKKKLKLKFKNMETIQKHHKKTSSDLFQVQQKKKIFKGRLANNHTLLVFSFFYDFAVIQSFRNFIIKACLRSSKELGKFLGALSSSMALMQAIYYRFRIQEIIREKQMSFQFHYPTMHWFIPAIRLLNKRNDELFDIILQRIVTFGNKEIKSYI